MPGNPENEIFPIVDEQGNRIGQAPRSVCHDGISKLLHPVVHLHLFNKEGMLFLQKRTATKDIQPGKWDTSVGGHVDINETTGQALLRESREELGLEGFTPHFLRTYIWESDRERELVHTYYTISDMIPVTDPGEIDDGKFWSLTDIKANLGKDIFTPNFENEFSMIFITSDGTINPL